MKKCLGLFLATTLPIAVEALSPSSIVEEVDLRPCLEKRDEGFPSYAVAYNELMSIRREFCVADPNVDNWQGFLPLYRRVVDSQHAAPTQEVARLEAFIVTNFTLYVFATEDEQSPVKACFSGRLRCLQLMAQFQLVKGDRNMLFQLADWLSGADALPTDHESWSRDITRAHQIDNRMIFGDNKPPRIAGGVGRALTHFGPRARECNAKYEFRKVYNGNLAKFRVAALSLFYRTITNELNHLTVAERASLWDEFCRRGKASEAEKARAENLAAQSPQPNSALPSSPSEEDVSVDVEFWE